MISDILLEALEQIERYQVSMPDVYADWALDLQDTKHAMERMRIKLDSPGYGDRDPKETAVIQGIMETVTGRVLRGLAFTHEEIEAMSKEEREERACFGGRTKAEYDAEQAAKNPQSEIPNPKS